MLSKHLLPPRTLMLISLFIIVTYTTITIPLTETTYIVVIIIVTIDSVSSSLTVTSHNTITVIVPCNSICSTLTKSFTLGFSSRLVAKYTIFNLTITACCSKSPPSYKLFFCRTLSPGNQAMTSPVFLKTA